MDNPRGCANNSNLEPAEFVLLFMVIEAVMGNLAGRHIALYLYSDNTLTVHGVRWLAARSSLAAMNIIQVLVPQLQMTKASTITTLHIEGTQNAMMDIPSWLFGSTDKWHCAINASFLTLHSSFSPLPTQEYQNNYFSYVASIKVISILQTGI